MSKDSGLFIPSILFEDNHLLVVNKPAGMPTQSDRSGRDSLLEWCRRYIRESRRKPGNVFVGMVQRLDRPVPGVIVFARTSKAASRLSEQIRGGKMEKIYRAVVEGCLTDEGRLDHYLVRRGTLTVTGKDGETGARTASLRYRILGNAPGKSLVEILLLTGRKHQIRAQMSAIGHPALGDRKYGSVASLGPDHIALMCNTLSFRHPVREEHLVFTVPEPDWWPWP